MRAVDQVKVENASATGAATNLRGGKYLFAAVATFNGGTVGVEMLMPDGSTWTAISALSITAAGVATADLPPGQYRISIATATAVYAALTRVPGE